MTAVRLTVSLFISVLCVFLFHGIAAADIYRYKDENGVWHFTNIKTDRRYRLYLRTYKKKPSQYIKDYDYVIRQASKRFKLDPSLVRAVIKAESGFDENAVSQKGARGLMQLMPGTAEDMDVEDPFSPEENIFGGTRYLALMMKRFKKNIRLALAAYNAGPEKVEQYKGIPPFQETKDFINRVLKYYNQYNATSE